MSTGLPARCTCPPPPPLSLSRCICGVAVDGRLVHDCTYFSCLHVNVRLAKCSRTVFHDLGMHCCKEQPTLKSGTEIYILAMLSSRGEMCTYGQLDIPTASVAAGGRSRDSAALRANATARSTGRCEDLRPLCYSHRCSFVLAASNPDDS